MVKEIIKKYNESDAALRIEKEQEREERERKKQEKISAFDALNRGE